ncbi:MAG: AmpG family muropeptide MFS transporter [Deltaproteobacteria bacterium]|nr:AmpG family muropeptide MFS transporter [Deltaproteobacteria bacterium]MBW2068555.1 AmpG family muropeptide MFS transporter [Deltaproteobacteria bacterium]
MKKFIEIYLNRRVSVLTGLGFSSGLPLALTGSTLQAWLMTFGTDIRIIGLFSIVGLPYTFKPIWSPLLDRFSPPFLGRRRGWILLFQLILATIIATMGLLNPRKLPLIAAIMALSIALFSASQDIVIDAYRTEILKPEERGAGAATTVFGYRMAMLVSGGLALMLSDLMPWKTVFLLLGITMALCTLFTALSPEPENQSKTPSSLKEAVVLPFADYFSRPSAVSMLFFIILFKLGDVLAAAMTTPFLLDLGFSRSEIGLVYKAFGLASTLAGAGVGGTILAAVGLNRSLWIFAGLQAISNLSFAVLASLGKNHAMLIAAVAVENIAGGMGTAGFVAFLMSLCNTRFTATQYALLSSLMAVTRVVAGIPTGFMAAHFGWTMYYVLSTLGAVPGILLLPKFAPWNSEPETLAGQNDKPR